MRDAVNASDGVLDLTTFNSHIRQSLQYWTSKAKRRDNNIRTAMQPTLAILMTKPCGSKRHRTPQMGMWDTAVYDSISKRIGLTNIILLAVITRPPDGVLLAPSALAARRLRRLVSLLEL